MEQARNRRSAHDIINDLREEFGFERDDSEDSEIEKAERRARMKRIEEAGTIENYVKLFNRDYWTDEWLGPGPEEPMPYLDLSPKDMKKLEEINRAEWREKYIKQVDTYVLPNEPKESKAIRKARKARKQMETKLERQPKYDVAYWLLESFLRPEEAWKIYSKFAGRFEEMIDFCYEYALSWAQGMTYNDEDRNHTMAEAVDRIHYQQQEDGEVVMDVDGLKFKHIEVAERKKRYYEVDLTKNSYPDIPDEYWKEFCKWSEDHPLSEFRKKAKKLGWGVSAAGLRRAKFLKMINKRNKGFRKRMMLHDPVTGASFVSEKKMKEHINKQLKVYDKRRAEFIKILDEMVAKNEISEEMAIGWMGDTKEARDRVEKRYRRLEKMVKKNQKEDEKREAHEKKVEKERRSWYKKFGGEITKPFSVEIDGELITVERIDTDKNSRPIYKTTRATGTEYSESLEFI